MKQIYHSPQIVLLALSPQDVLTVSVTQDQGVGDMGWLPANPNVTPTMFE